ncbi:hypothetical protein OAW29_03105 [Planktomarina temperata]|nr:hypothetical protein [Planktomarina temperata]
MNKQCHKAAAIVVLYYPDVSLLRSCIKSLGLSIEHVYFYINSKPSDDLGDILSNCPNVYGNGENVGLARATNILLNIINDRNYEFALISDQDTIYPPNFITTMTSDRINGAVRVPLWQQLKTQRIGGYYKLHKGKIVYKKKVSFGEEVLFSIASGMVISLQEIGSARFNEEMFIDFLDTEFCMRIVATGNAVVVNTEVMLQHDLGYGVAKVFGRDFTTRGPLRDFYITRNSIYLSLRPPPIPNISFKLRMFFLRFALKHFIFSILTSNNKIMHLSLQLSAIKYGIIGRLGAYSGGNIDDGSK